MPMLKCSLFSRLGRIRQLNNAWAIYPSALNTRYIHALGVMHLAGTFASDILHRSLIELRELKEYKDLESKKIEGIIRIARFWGLIHDIGHGPFSHAFEFYVLFDKGYNHETIVPEIYKHDKQFKKVINDFVNEIKKYYGGSFSAQLLLDIFRIEGEQKELQNHEILYILSKLIKGPTYSLDEIDYLLRDSHFCGTPEYGTIDWKRIMSLSRIIFSKELKKIELILEEKALQALFNYYWSKFFMYNAVYYHNRCHAIEKYLREIFIFLKDQDLFKPYIHKSNLKNYHILDDSFILNTLLEKKQKITDRGLKRLFTDYYQKLIDLYNFEIPFTYLGKSNNNEITQKIILAAPMDRIKIASEYQVKFVDEVKVKFNEKIKELRQEKDKQVFVEKLEDCYNNYVNNVFFHHIVISANDKDFIDTKSAIQHLMYKTKGKRYIVKKFYMLNEQMEEKDVSVEYRELIEKIPYNENESKILVPNDLYDVLVEDFPEMIETILRCYENIDKTN